MKKKDAKVLDTVDTDSVIMPFMQHEYEIEYKGRIVRCKTAEAATRILRLLEQEDTSKDQMKWSPHDFTEFTSRVQWQQRRLLAALLEHEPTTWVTSERLREILHITTNQGLAGVLSGITKVAMSLDIEPERVYLQTTRFKNGKPQKFYRAGSGFLRAAVEYEWPSKDDLKVYE
jgi:hypothetical protein